MVLTLVEVQNISSFDGNNDIQTVSVLDAGAGYTNTNNIAIRAKTGNTFGINDPIDIAMLTFDRKYRSYTFWYRSTR